LQSPLTTSTKSCTLRAIKLLRTARSRLPPASQLVATSEFPQSTRCLPSCHRSPKTLTADSEISGKPIEDKSGFLDETTRAIFGRGYAAEPEVLIEQLRKDEAIAEADTLLLTVPTQLGVAYVAYNAHVMEAILTTVAPALGWR
jgi:hypothetical protein